MHAASVRDIGRSGNRGLGIVPLLAGTPAAKSELEGRILDQLEFGIAVVDAAGQMDFANVAMMTHIHRGGFIGRTPGCRLYFSHSETESQFRAALGKACKGIADSCVTFLAGGEMHAPKCVVTLQPLARQSAGDRSVMVTITPISASSASIPADQIMESFGLTAAEKRLAQFLMTGGCLADAARSFGLSVHTVRNQLRAVFAKMGVRRQSDLTRLLYGGHATSAAA